MKKAFSLIEIIIVIALIAIVSSMGVYKLFFTVDQSHNLLVKTQIHLIKNGIVQQQNKRLLLGQKDNLVYLDEASVNTTGELLFNKVLNQPLISSSQSNKKIAQWIKLSANEYQIYLNQNQSLTFIYNHQKGSFECDYDLILCQEMYQ